MLKFIQKSLISVLRKVLSVAGVVIYRRTVETDSDLQNSKTVCYLKTDLVLDVGANEGQYAMALRRNGYEGDILSIEPIPEAHRQLKRNSILDPKWSVEAPCAVSDVAGETDFNVSGNSVSSSLREIGDLHVEAAPKSRTEEVIKVKVSRLDDVFSNWAVSKTGFERLFIKIDVQGSELEVLKGASKVLQLAVGVQLELSLSPLYEDQATWETVNDFMFCQGFKLWSVQQGFGDSLSGRTLQFDGVYIQEKLIETFE